MSEFDLDVRVAETTGVLSSAQGIAQTGEICSVGGTCVTCYSCQETCYYTCMTCFHRYTACPIYWVT